MSPISQSMFLPYKSFTLFLIWKWGFIYCEANSGEANEAAKKNQNQHLGHEQVIPHHLELYVKLVFKNIEEKVKCRIVCFNWPSFWLLSRIILLEEKKGKLIWVDLITSLHFLLSKTPTDVRQNIHFLPSTRTRRIWLDI